MESLAIEDGSLWLCSLWLSRNGVFGYRENEPLAIEEWDLWLWESLALAEWESLAMEEWNGVASLGRGLGASRGLVGSSRLNFSRSLS